MDRIGNGQQTIARIHNAVKWSCRVLAIVPSPVEAGLAYEVLTQSRSAVAASASDSSAYGHSRVCVSFLTMKGSQVLPSESADPSTCRAVWLSYHATKAMGASELQRCDKWSDINNLLERGWINATNSDSSCLGVHIKYSNVGLIWEHSHIDWLVSGMKRAARAHGLRLETRYVCDFTFRAPHVLAIFQVSRGNAKGELGCARVKEDIKIPTATIPLLPNHFREWNGDWAMIGDSDPASPAGTGKEDSSTAAASTASSRTTFGETTTPARPFLLF